MGIADFDQVRPHRAVTHIKHYIPLKSVLVFFSQELFCTTANSDQDK